MTFDDSFFVDAEFIPAVVTVSVQGSPVTRWPGPGVTVRVSVQPRQVMRLDESGRVISATRFEVFMRSDPSALNGGKGVRQNDRFLWAGRTLAAAGDAVNECSPGSVPLWRVECSERI